VIEATPVRFVISVNPDIAPVVEAEEVDRTLAKSLIGDVAVTALGVVDLWTFGHRRQV
jgi:hypothetical protein